MCKEENKKCACKITHCKNCKNRKEDVVYNDQYLCKLLRMWVKIDDYCCWAEPE